MGEEADMTLKKKDNTELKLPCSLSWKKTSGFVGFEKQAA